MDKKIFIYLIIAAVFVIVGVLFMNQSSIEEPIDGVSVSFVPQRLENRKPDEPFINESQEIDRAGRGVADYDPITSVDIEIVIPNLYEGEEYQKYCVPEPVGDGGIGALIYPSEPRHENLGYLGQFFTLYRCGRDWTGREYDEESPLYNLGINLSLDDDPSAGLLSYLQATSFECNEEVSEKNCRSWSMYNPINKNILIGLDKFANEISATDCIHCG